MKQVYYDPKGKQHIIETRFSYGLYVIDYDNRFYAAVDDRPDVDEVVHDLIQKEGLSIGRKAKKKTPRKRQQANSGV